MRIRATALTAVLMLWPSTGCSAPSANSTTPPAPPVVLSSEQLANRLLTTADLGSGYTARPTTSRGSTPASVLDCEPLEQMGQAVADPYAVFPSRAKAVFTDPGGAQVTEELYSALPKELSATAERIMDAMTACPVYQIATATAVTRVYARTVPAPPLGEEQWSQVNTVSAGGRSSTVQQTVVRDGALLLVVSGTPDQVALHVRAALAKATAS